MTGWQNKGKEKWQCQKFLMVTKDQKMWRAMTTTTHKKGWLTDQ